MGPKLALRSEKKNGIQQQHRRTNNNNKNKKSLYYRLNEDDKEDGLPPRKGGGGGGGGGRGGGLKTPALLLIAGLSMYFANIRGSTLPLVEILDYVTVAVAPIIIIATATSTATATSNSNSTSTSTSTSTATATATSVSSDSYPIPHIEELVKFNTTATATATSCPPGLTPITNTYYPTSVVYPPGRKIPKIIHITSKYRCATPAVIKNVDKWRFQNYSVYFHDDQAIEKLFTHPYARSQFPTLREALKCVTSGATKADLWRYLVLYIYGGVYTDIDNSPTGFNGETIKDNDDSFFVIEKLGIMSQYFIASSFGHPLMAKMLEAGSEKLKSIGNVMNNHAAQTTGPWACKVGFVLFMKEAGVETNGYINAGVYFGENNRSVTVKGTKARSKDYVNRGGLDGRDKTAYYEALGIAHFSKRPGPNTGAFSCKEHLKRTNGTDKVANYRYVEELKAYVEVNTTVNTTVQANIPSG